MARAAPRFVLFDYGNTLVPFGRREAALLAAEQARLLAERVPGLDPVAFEPEVLRVKEALIRGTRDTGRECTVAELAEALAAAAGLAATAGAPHLGYGGRGAPGGFEGRRWQGPRGLVGRPVGARPRGEPGEPRPYDAADLSAALEERTARCFESVLRLPPDTLPVLDALRERFRLAVVSNYFLVRPILRTLEGFGIATRLEAAVVSAEVGWVKPRPEPFREALRRLGARPAECVFVGDNLHADVGGAAALGMRTVLTREWVSGALAIDVEAGPGAPRPDAVVDRLADLPGILR